MTISTRRGLIKDIVGAALFMLLGGVFAREMHDLPANVQRYPLAIIYLIFALSLILAAKSVASLIAGRFASEPPPEEGEKTGFPTVFVLILSFLYVLAMPYIGFALASAVMMVAFMLVMGVRSWPILVLVPVCEIAFLLYVFETLLAVFLPDADALREWLGMI